jgi:CTP synthase
VPLILEQEGLAQQVLTQLNLEDRQPDLSQWQTLVDQLHQPTKQANIAIVGKYVRLSDAYLSVVESIHHASLAAGISVNLHWINSEEIEEKGADSFLAEMHGIIVPGGFGVRGVDGKIEAIRYAREHRVPFLGLCLGMQCAVIEWARNLGGFPDAHSAEFDSDTPHPVINLLPEQQDVVDLGGTMRLGLYPCKILPGSLAGRLYKEPVIYERHRHRYEFNNAYRSPFLESGYLISGTSPDGRLVEMVERPDHPFFIATQFHPEFLSRPNTPHPLFRGFMQAVLRQDVTTLEKPEDKLDHVPAVAYSLPS